MLTVATASVYTEDTSYLGYRITFANEIVELLSTRPITRIETLSSAYVKVLSDRHWYVYGIDSNSNKVGWHVAKSQRCCGGRGMKRARIDSDPLPPEIQ